MVADWYPNEPYARLFRADVTGGVRLVMWFVSSRAACSHCAVEVGGLLGGARPAIVRHMKELLER